MNITKCWIIIRMKNKIISAFGNEKLEHKENINYAQIHVADLRRRTDNVHGLEVYATQPENIDTLLIENPNLLDISAAFFKPQCFQDEHGKDISSCEGVFYLADSTDKTWVLFLELKDSKPRNISRHLETAINQIKQTVEAFRTEKIIAQNKLVYANISFPRRNKTGFYNKLLGIEAPKELIDHHKIILHATNKLKIESNTKIIGVYKN